MPTQTVDFQLPSGSRKFMRETLIKCFLSESPGSGKGDLASRYRYNVEMYDSYGIYLKRPTQLNKGFDFTVNVQGMYFRKNKRYSNPSHKDICDALSYCRGEYPDEYDKVRTAIFAIYKCENIDLSNINAFFLDYKGSRHPIQIILLAIKWLFMEQDCAYWNHSGRRMLYEKLQKEDLV